MSVPNQENWYALYTRSNFEKKIYYSLINSQVNAFLPMIKQKHTYSDRKKTIEIPLVPGYVFVFTSENYIPQLCYYTGVVRVVRIEGKPCVVDPQDILRLKTIVKLGIETTCKPVICDTGRKVQVVRGPLKGWEGFVSMMKSKFMVVFQVSGIYKSLSVEIDSRNLKILN